MYMNAGYSNPNLNYWRGQSSGMQYIPSMNECNFMALEVSFRIKESYAHDWNFEGEPMAFVRKGESSFTSVLVEKPGGWWNI
jgi:hypothetical protein